MKSKAQDTFLPVTIKDIMIMGLFFWFQSTEISKSIEASKDERWEISNVLGSSNFLLIEGLNNN